MAGGMGSRMNSEPYMPKALLTLQQETLLDRIIQQIQSGEPGVGVVISTRPEFYQLFLDFVDRYNNEQTRQIEVLSNPRHSRSLLEATLFALETFPSLSVMVLGDIYFDENPFIANFDSNTDLLISTKFSKLPKSNNGVIVKNSKGSLKLYKRARLISIFGKSCAYWTGLFSFSPRFVSDLERYLKMANKGDSLDEFINYRINVLGIDYAVKDGYSFFNINTQKDLALARQQLYESQYV